MRVHEARIIGERARDERAALRVRAAAVCLISLSSVACSQHGAPSRDGSWDPRAAAAYLDRRMEWWSTWKNSARDHGTYCFSCHTAVPYALARPALSVALAESAAPAPERQLLDDVRRRVRLWNESVPFYTDQYVGAGKSAESRGTEAVLSALMLAWEDARTGRLSADTATALEHMWAEQHVSGDSAGTWSWLDFDLSPWESGAADDQYYGAALAALAVGMAPENYQSRPQIQQQLLLLRGYLAREYAAQSLHHRLTLLWASTKLPGLLDADQRQSLIADALRVQNPDGGWSLATLMSSSAQHGGPGTPPESDGYATGLTTLVLEQTSMPAAAPQLQAGLTWLARNQLGHGGSWIWGQKGFWMASSLNKWRNPWSNVGRFMSDAATAYAVLALTQTPQSAPQVAVARK
jgi:squalene-hopene/tetraprenyl-beta-curcumene cyclase